MQIPGVWLQRSWFTGFEVRRKGLYFNKILGWFWDSWSRNTPWKMLSQDNILSWLLFWACMRYPKCPAHRGNVIDGDQCHCCYRFCHPSVVMAIFFLYVWSMWFAFLPCADLYWICAQLFGTSVSSFLEQIIYPTSQESVCCYAKC